MAYSHDKSKWAIPLVVVAFIAVFSTIAFSWLSMVIFFKSIVLGSNLLQADNIDLAVTFGAAVAVLGCYGSTFVAWIRSLFVSFSFDTYNL